MFEQQPTGLGLEPARVWRRVALAVLLFALMIAIVSLMEYIGSLLPPYIPGIFWLIVGFACILYAALGKTFRWSGGLGSNRPGPRMPQWLGRIFFFFWGIFAIWTGLQFARP